VSSIIPSGAVAWGLQLPIQAQSTIFVEPWEADATTDDLVAVARAADRAGALYVGVCEHVAIPKPYDGPMGTTWYHPFTTLGFLAGVTTRVRLLSHVIALPYHHPLEVAKAFTTLDRLSGGRAIVGVGAGHVEPEFALLGVSFADRGTWVERSLPAIRAALDDEYPALADGDWGLDGSAAISPRPVQTSVPLWVGGSTPVAVRRAAQYGDGWLPQGVKPPTSRATSARPAGRSAGPTSASPSRSPLVSVRGSRPAPTSSSSVSTHAAGPSWSTRSSVSAPRWPRCWRDRTPALFRVGCRHGAAPKITRRRCRRGRPATWASGGRGLRACRRWCGR
jgi:probable F420-dependent oxidoreductase